MRLQHAANWKTVDGATPHRAVPSVSLWMNRHQRSYGAVSALVGLGWGWQVSIGGQLYVAEILSALVVLLSARSLMTLMREQVFARAALGFGLFLFGLVLADTVNDSTTANLTRGWAGAVFAFIDTIAAVLLTRGRPTSVGLYALGRTAAFVFGGATLQGEGSADYLTGESNAFKAEIAPALMSLLLSILVLRSRQVGRFAPVGLTVFGLVFLFLNARSAGLVLIGSAAIPVLNSSRVSRDLKLALSVVTIALAGFGYRHYVDLELEREYSSSAQQLRRTENPYNPLELLFVGRGDTFAAVPAIAEKPLLGWGSWAQDPNRRFQILQARKTGASHISERPYIPSHSVLLAAWLWGGILGLIGVSTVIAPAIRRLWRGATSADSLRFACALVFLEFSWHALFSPLGHLRTTFPLFIALSVIGFQSRPVRTPRSH